jgi:hypothetical protein
MDQRMSEDAGILSKPSVGGMEVCQRCGHHKWEHNVDIVVDGKIVRPKNENRAPNICQYQGSVRCCFAFCQNFE